MVVPNIRLADERPLVSLGTTFFEPESVGISMDGAIFQKIARKNMVVPT